MTSNKRIIFKWHGMIWLAVLILWASGSLAADGKKVLVMNSNGGILKYRTVQEEFGKTGDFQIMVIDLAGKKADKKQIGKARHYNPDLVYCIGSGAYQTASQEFKNKKIVFSSIINWLRLTLSDQTYGISNELHTRMTLTMYRYLFPDLHKIGVLYSRQYTMQWFENVKAEAGELGIEIIGRIVKNKKGTFKELKLLSKDVDALWLIADPLVMPEKSYLFKILETADDNKLPVFSYHEAFARFGASLVVSADNPTIGRQAAGIASALLTDTPPDDPVQYPAGSHITLNLKKVEAYGLNYNKDALSAVNNVIK